jgi:hypothetical protein
MLDDLRTSGVISRKKNLKEEGPWSTLSHEGAGDNQGRNNDRTESVWTFRDGPPNPASHNRIKMRGVRPSLLRQRCKGLHPCSMKIARRSHGYLLSSNVFICTLDAKPRNPVPESHRLHRDVIETSSLKSRWKHSNSFLPNLHRH